MVEPASRKSYDPDSRVDWGSKEYQAIKTQAMGEIDQLLNDYYQRGYRQGYRDAKDGKPNNASNHNP